MVKKDAVSYGLEIFVPKSLDDEQTPVRDEKSLLFLWCIYTMKKIKPLLPFNALIYRCLQSQFESYTNFTLFWDNICFQIKYLIAKFTLQVGYYFTNILAMMKVFRKPFVKAHSASPPSRSTGTGSLDSGKDLARITAPLHKLLLREWF